MRNIASTDDIYKRLAPTGRRQHGLVTREQVTGAGATARWLNWQLASGQFQAVERDVYLLPGNPSPSSFETLAMAACLQRGDARLGYGTAARVWKLCEGQRRDDKIDVLVPATSGHRSTERVKIHRTRRLDSRDGAWFDDIPITTVARTIVDLGSVLAPDAVDRLIDDALIRELTSIVLLTSSIRRNCRQGCDGCNRVRAAFAPWLDGLGDVESHAEAVVLRWLRGLEIPKPVRQHEIYGPNGFIARVDFAWPERRVVLEVDGFRHHYGPRQMSHDHERRNALEAAGWRVLTTTMAEILRGGGSLRTALLRALAGR